MATEVRKININEDCKTISVDFATAQPTTVVIQDSNDTVVELDNTEFTYANGNVSF